MKELFAQRRFEFHQQCLKYLRYVFNDHFTLVLLIFLGFLLVQYQHLLSHFPTNHVPVYLCLIAISLTLLWLGRIATYLEPADQVFILTKEAQILEQVRSAKRRTFLIWGSLIFLVYLVLMPVFLVLGLTKFEFMFCLVLMLVLKALVIHFKGRRLVSDNHLQWEEAINLENSRKQSILKFFALFTTVKGISTKIKRRAYLDPLLNPIPKTRTTLWRHLFLRAYLRSGDYFGLSLRLLILSLLAIMLVASPLIAAELAVLFDFLLLFQLLSLYQHYDYQYTTELFPVGTKDKKKQFKQVLRSVLYTVLILEMICLLLFAFSWQALLVLLGVGILLVEVYLPYKLKKVIDELS